MDHRSHRFWPIVATVLAVLFISFDLHLVSRARDVQQRMGAEVELLDALARMSRAVSELATMHRVDLHTGRGHWEERMTGLRADLDRTAARFSQEPGMTELRPRLLLAFDQADSLHHLAEVQAVDLREERTVQAILQLVAQRASKTIDRTARAVHEQGLSVHSAQLSRRWDEAQVLMFLSCLMAVVFALLVGMNRRLLVDSRQRGDQLAEAKQRLEQTNRELRETMLSKEEKEVMLKEIHHRVKNNLQIVKSLIRFQTDQVDDPRVKELFNECITRVSAMALVHEQTYLSKDLANIDVRSYLESLVRDLIHAYAVGVRLRQDIDIQVRTLGVDTLVPLGLLINEIISNSFKYAFKGRMEGTLTVHLSGSEEDGLLLRIGDDGPGIPGRDKWERPNSLGMELIHTLAGQLDADIDLLPVAGTHYELRGHKVGRRKVA
ncbi:MAG: sensor histidine kinase [Flavobacteriales bacterium]|nr:sensor histidine kinase [Flavobacteriales bacterium]